MPCDEKKIILSNLTTFAYSRGNNRTNISS
jgi:hypothetical protein